ncbi:hypothetical protein B0H12DRAFT_1232587 [Mycena haematopus]|nr:hypothetical protein B0H12DRAFT_1232587 [Mycena haematopus]
MSTYAICLFTYILHPTLQNTSSTDGELTLLCAQAYPECVVSPSLLDSHEESWMRILRALLRSVCTTRKLEEDAGQLFRRPRTWSTSTSEKRVHGS